jgi:hypothetical protein
VRLSFSLIAMHDLYALLAMVLSCWGRDGRGQTAAHSAFGAPRQPDCQFATPCTQRHALDLNLALSPSFLEVGYQLLT